MLPLNRFLSFVDQHQLFSQEDRILLALSGGRDSVLLAHLLNEAGINFGIAHCNFGLRDLESDEDEKFAQALAGSLNVPFYVAKFDTKNYALTHGLSTQMAARALRYPWFERIRQENGYTCIALAHHQSDVTETILLNLLRGTGISGLHGILPKRGRLVRPLLFLTRREIDETIDQEGFPYREDSSNSSTYYARNKLRLEVIPKLKELNPALDMTFRANSERFLEIETFLSNEVNRMREALFTSLKDGSFEIQLKPLAALTPRKLLLYELFKPFHFSEKVLDDLQGAWSGQPGKVFESPSHILILDREKLFLVEKELRVPEELIIQEGDDELVFDAVRIRCKVSDKDTLPFAGKPVQAFFDYSLLQFPLKLRQWKKGDVFYPFGMGGKKKLSDFFTGLKIPLHKKREIPVLLNGNGDILWVVGFRSDNRYKVGPHTKKVITFETF